MNFKKEAKKIVDFIMPVEQEKNDKWEIYVATTLKMAYTQGQIDRLKELIKEKEA